MHRTSSDLIRELREHLESLIRLAPFYASPERVEGMIFQSIVLLLAMSGIPLVEASKLVGMVQQNLSTELHLDLPLWRFLCQTRPLDLESRGRWRLYEESESGVRAAFETLSERSRELCRRLEIEL